MRAAIIAVGSELLGTDRVDTNSLRITTLLERFGVDLVGKAVVGDEVSDIVTAVRHALARVDLLVIGGGLGPTEDDLTREAVADALDRGLSRDDSLLTRLRERFQEYGIEMPSVNEKQADVIEGATVLTNPHGTAPGLRLDEGNCTIFLFPGVPSELEWMLGAYVDPWFRDQGRNERVESRILKVACVGESTLEERILPAYEEFGRRGISVLSSPGDIEVRLTVKGPRDERTKRLSDLTCRMRELLGSWVYGEGSDVSLEVTVGALLTTTGRRLATAESCTGGLVAERLTRIAGSSAFFMGGVIAYDNEAKQSLLGVKTETIERCGAVSRAVVKEMCCGVIERFNADLAIGISGVAGPGGGTSEKPVGTVFVGLAEKDRQPEVRRLKFLGDRERIRWLASQWALESVRRRLADPDGPTEGAARSAGRARRGSREDANP